MITIALTSQKGGVGKSTVALNLACAVAKRGWKTLLVDTDPQGSIGYSLTAEASEQPGFYQLITEQLQISHVAMTTRVPTLHIMTAGEVPAHDFFRWHQAGEHAETMSPFFHQARHDGYDVVLVDTACGVHGPTQGILRNVEHLLIPQQSEPLASRSLRRYFEVLGELLGDGANFSIVGIVLTMLNFESEGSNRIANDLREAVPDNMVLNTVVPRDAAFVEASLKGLPLELVQRGNIAAASSFEHLASELEIRLGMTRKEDDEPVSLLDG